MTDPHHRTYRVTIPSAGGPVGPTRSPAPSGPPPPGSPLGSAPPSPRGPRLRDKVIAATLGVGALAAVGVAAWANTGEDESSTTAADSEGGQRSARTTASRTRSTTTEAPTTTTTTAPPPPPFDGVGPSVIDVTKGDEAFVAFITANAAGSYCGIKSFDAAGEQVDLLVNTTEPYEGLRPVDFELGQRTARFQVECEGPWHIELRPLDTLVGVGAGETRVHRGDDVFVVRDADTLTISGNAESRYMGVHAYDVDDGDIELLVNTTDPYQGEVIAPETAIVVVQSETDWSVTNNP